jgi:hypothetical protein
VLARLCAFEEALFLRTLLSLAEPERAGLEILFTDAVMTRIAALPYRKYHGVFLPCAKHLPGFDVHHYRHELRPYLLRHSAQQGCRQVWAPMTAAALYAKEMAELAFVAEDILPVGATLFVGRAKDGKSLAMWNLLFAVATGGIVFGKYPTSQGPVLYLALEDGERRTQKRLKNQMRAFKMTEPPADFDLQHWEAPRVGEGLEDKLHEWIDAHPGAKLIVIDILEKIRPLRTKGGSVYADDYAAVISLQRLAQDRSIAIVIVHHTNKAKAEDFRNTPSGAESLLGGVDTLWSLRRVAGETDAVLQITGREVIENAEIAMQFKDGFWTARGDAATTVLNPAHQAIIDTLRTTGYPMTPTQLATVLTVNVSTMKVHLLRLVERGLVAKTGQGQYVHRVLPPESAEGVTDCNPVTQASTEPPACPAVAPDVSVEEDDPIPQDIPRMDTPAPVDATPEESYEEPPEAQAGIQVTRVTRDVAPTTDPTPAPSNGHGQPATNGSSNGHRPGHVPLMLIPCANCHGTERWNDHGTWRCVTCWPRARG